MKSDPALTHTTLKVLRFLLESQGKDVGGADITRQTGILSGVMYPILARLERAQWLSSHWETLSASELGRPRKRLYHFTSDGLLKARAAFAELVRVQTMPITQVP